MKKLLESIKKAINYLSTIILMLLIGFMFGLIFKEKFIEFITALIRW